MKRITFLTSLLGSIPLLSSFKQIETSSKTQFTVDDLVKNNYGLFIINDKVKDVTKRPGYAATLCWKLGYTHTRSGGYTMTNFLTDGWTNHIGDTKQAVCEYLNNNPYGQKYRLMTKEEIIYLISNRNQGFL